MLAHIIFAGIEGLRKTLSSHRRCAMLPRTMIAGAVAGFLASGSAHAEVAVGPNSVDAPYVHVDWGPGRLHVVAPFVNLCMRAPTGCQAGAPRGFQAEPIPTPPAQSNFRPSGERPLLG